jgi:hypothetical protein
VTFLCTIDGELVPGERETGGRPPRDERGVRWPQPWGFECDDCGRRFPYGCVVLKASAKFSPPTMLHVGADQHRCAYCNGYAEPAVQLGLEVTA